MLYLHAHPVSKPLSFCTSIFTEKVPHLYTFLLKKRYPFTSPLEDAASLFLSLRMKSMNNITREHWSRIFKRDVNQANKYSIFSSCSHGTWKISHFKNTLIWKASQSRVKWRLSFCDILFCSRGGGGTPRKIGLGCAVRFPKPLPYLWPKSMEARSGQNCNNKIAAQVRISSH